MESSKKQGRYKRIISQLEGLLEQDNGMLARMATINAVLHHKFDYFFWTGFYILKEEKLIVGPYQGPVACQLLSKDTGVCWASVNSGESQIVEDVSKFPGHIACDSRSRSEIVIPMKDNSGKVTAVLDVDSSELSAFDETDRENLEIIIGLI